jgi:hypothetical protein
MFPIIEVPAEAADSPEQLGSKFKFWFHDPNGQRVLFKQGRSGTGENWAEKISAELCVLLDIPHAVYDLAIWRDIQGVVSPSFVPAGARLIFGNELLARVVAGYKRETRYYGQSDHTIARVFAVLRDPAIQVPRAWQETADMRTASDVFAGYLMLDALIGNTDRHHENWGLVLQTTTERQDLRLAPTFDHASSLGRNETDERRTARLATTDQAFSAIGYAERSRSAFYRGPTDRRPLSTFAAFGEVLRRRTRAAQAWISRLHAVSDLQLRAVIDEVPSEFISSAGREFAYRLVLINKARIVQLMSAG